MTKTYKEIEVTTTKKEVVKTVCDWCGEEIKKPKSGLYECSKANPETDITFSMVHGCCEDSYGDGWSIEDLCEECGKKLKSALVNLGINVTDFDW